MTNDLRPSGFPIDEPVIVELANPEGIAEEGRWGWQSGYALADGRTLWLKSRPPNVDSGGEPYPSEMLDNLGLAAGEQVVITRRQRRSGNRRFVDFEMQRLAPASEEPSHASQPNPGETAIHPGGGGVDQPARPVPAAIPQGVTEVPIEHLPNRNTACLGTPVMDARPPAEIVNMQGKVTPIDGKSAAPMTDTERLLAASIQKAKDEKTPPDVQLNGHAPVNGAASAAIAADAANGHAANGNKPKLDAAGIAVLARATLLTKCIRLAIASAKEGEAFGKEIGYDVRFSSDDIVRWSITSLIGEQQNGRNGRY
jgi:hypothetical protein